MFSKLAPVLLISSIAVSGHAQQLPFFPASQNQTGFLNCIADVVDQETDQIIKVAMASQARRTIPLLSPSQKDKMYGGTLGFIPSKSGKYLTWLWASISLLDSTPGLTFGSHRIQLSSYVYDMNPGPGETTDSSYKLLKDKVAIYNATFRVFAGKQIYRMDSPQASISCLITSSPTELPPAPYIPFR